MSACLRICVSACLRFVRLRVYGFVCLLSKDLCVCVSKVCMPACLRICVSACLRSVCLRV